MDFYDTDPEFMERFDKFAFDEVVNETNQQLPNKIRYMSILAALLGCQCVDIYKEMLVKALDECISPVEAKEIVYQAVNYLGIGRVIPFLKVTNDIFRARNIDMPLKNQATTTFDNRLEKGVEVQSKIFGEQMKYAWKTGHINRWLASNCFGDYYTRNGLDLKQREIITFCFLAAQGGCEEQLVAHSKGNINLGNDKEFLIKVISQCLPYIGYPRSINAVSCVNKASE